MRTLLLVPALLVACSSEEGEAPHVDAAASAASLIRTCAGTVVCTQGASVSERQLVRGAEGCLAGGQELLPDGTVRGNPDATWSETPDGFSLCIAAQCLTCASGAAPEEDEAKSCHGLPDDCSSGSPGSCSDIRGCSVHFRVRWNGDLEPECRGVADSCSSMTSAASCRKQGCSWR